MSGIIFIEEPPASGVGTKRCLCGAEIADKYIMCSACNQKLKDKSKTTEGEKDSKLLEVLNHINWNLGRIAKTLEEKKRG